jgi:hypothetical protein
MLLDFVETPIIRQDHNFFPVSQRVRRFKTMALNKYSMDAGFSSLAVDVKLAHQTEVSQNFNDKVGITRPISSDHISGKKAIFS